MKMPYERHTSNLHPIRTNKNILYNLYDHFMTLTDIILKII